MESLKTFGSMFVAFVIGSVIADCHLKNKAAEQEETTKKMEQAKTLIDLEWEVKKLEARLKELERNMERFHKEK